MQTIVGKSMIKILDRIHNNHFSHFKEMKVEFSEHIDSENYRSSFIKN